MIRAIAAFAVAICVVFSMSDVAAAKTRHHHPVAEKSTFIKASYPRRHKRKPIYAPVIWQAYQSCDNQYCNVSQPAAQQYSSKSVKSARYYEEGHVVGGRPGGCPHAFCGCEASLYKFGRIIPYLNLAWNWTKKFPRAAPAPGMAAARSHHVMILISQVDGPNWLVHDGNSGNHLTRDHVRSITGYVIVNPNAQLASR